VSVSSLEDNLTESLQLARPNRLTGPIVFSDGIGSAGKRMLGHIVASLSSVEKMSHHFVFDYVAALHWLKKISDDGAITYLQTEADLQLYQQFLGRDVNFRPRDTSGVWANPGWGRYLKRLFSPEGDDVLKRLGADSPVLHEATHDGLRSASLFFRAFGERLKIVHILRNPSDLISDLYRRGFGSRVGSDPREFQLTLAGPVSPVHIYMADIAGEVSSWSALDFSAETVARSLSANLLGYKALTVGYASQVQFVFLMICALAPRRKQQLSPGSSGKPQQSGPRERFGARDSPGLFMIVQHPKLPCSAECLPRGSVLSKKLTDSMPSCLSLPQKNP